MKKTIVIIFFIAVTVMAMAQSNKLASVKIFEEIDVYDPSLTVMIVEKKDKIVKSVSFKNNPDLQKIIKKAVATDRAMADSKSLSSSNGEISEYLDIVTEDEKIRIGLNQTQSKETYFFVNILPLKDKTFNSGNSEGRRRKKQTKVSKPSKPSKPTKKSSKTGPSRTSRTSSKETMVITYCFTDSNDVYCIQEYQ